MFFFLFGIGKVARQVSEQCLSTVTLKIEPYTRIIFIHCLHATNLMPKLDFWYLNNSRKVDQLSIVLE